MERKHIAEDYAKIYSPHGIDMTSDVMEKLKEVIISSKISELHLMFFADYIKENLNRFIEVRHTSDENGLMSKTEWSTDWIDTHENLPIFNDLVLGELDDCETFENVSRQLFDKMICNAVESYEKINKEIPGNGLVYLAYHNTLILLSVGGACPNHEAMKIEYIHWYHYPEHSVLFDKK